MANTTVDLDATTKKGFKKVQVKLNDNFSGYIMQSQNDNEMIKLYGQVIIDGKIYTAGGQFTLKK